VNGAYTQSSKGTLVLRGKPLRVTGTVRLAGDLDVSALGGRGRPAREVTVLDHRGEGRISGTFKGLRQGARLKLGDTTYRIDYRAGDGNDVALTAKTAPSPSPTAPEASASGAVAPRSAGASQDTGFGWWPYALGLALVVSLAVPVAARRGRGRRRAGRHAARARQ
jgi:hypothetical protein